jgi:hypothetical protein
MAFDTEKEFADVMNWLFDATAGLPSAAGQDRVQVALQVFSELFLPEPVVDLDAAKREAFEALVREQIAPHSGAALDYTLPYPKHEFLWYLAHDHDYLLHGSQKRDLTEMIPARQTDWKGEYVQALFATEDGIWASFFALLRSEAKVFSIRNAGFVVDVEQRHKRRFYLFSVSEEARIAEVWAPGMIYVLPKERFEPVSRSAVRFDEWLSTAAVPVAARIALEAADFPFRNHVARHREEEAIHTTWRCYKTRLARQAP